MEHYMMLFSNKTMERVLILDFDKQEGI